MKVSTVNIRVICKSLICFLLGRVYIMMINPVAVAALLIVHEDKKNNGLYETAVILGIASGLLPGTGINGGSVIKYLLISVCILTIDRLAAKRGIVFNRRLIICIGAVVTFLINFGGGITEFGPALMLACTDAVVIIILANLMNKGMEWLDYGKPGYYMNGEQMISIIICITLSLMGIPDIMPDLLVISGMAYNIFLL